MKILQKITLYALLGASAMGCSSDFLEPEVDQYLTDPRKDELLLNSDNAETLINSSLRGIYNSNTKNLPGVTSHDVFGLKAILLALDETGLDVVQTKHTWFGFDYDFDNNQAPYRRTNNTWQFFYKQIAGSNFILENLFHSTEPTDANLQKKYAETLGIRGIMYYYLANIYQQTYKGNESAKCVSLVLKTSDENMPRASVTDIYNQIISDLTYAVEKNDVTADKKDVDKAVAAAYLAKTYAAMEDWVNVEKYAKIAANSTTLTPKATVESSNWDISTDSWLWGYDITAETSTLFASFYSHMDNTIGGYAGALNANKSIYNGLYDDIPNTDIRKKLFINKTLFPDIQKKYNLNDYANVKYVTSSDFTGDYCYLRVEDPFLLLVEALVEQNKLSEAKTTLERLLALRDSNYTSALSAVASDQNKFREYVRKQRRIELWGEGTAFFDFKRWKMPANRNTPNTNHRTNIDVPAGDSKWVYQIPQSEIDSNTNITAADQNP